jgi:predicted metalloprotease with PDZ domain
MTMATGNSYGGLEHCNSTSLITPRDDLPKAMKPEEPSKIINVSWGCVAMSISLWLIKFIRPETFANYDLNKEGYTRLLWIFEEFYFVLR